MEQPVSNPVKWPAKTEAARPIATAQDLQPCLILTAEQIFDTDRVMASVEALAKEAESTKALQAGVVEILMLARKAGENAIAQAIAEHPLDAGPAVRAYAHLMDGIVTTVFTTATTYLNPAKTPKDLDKVALLAVGGYGRAEMAPHSDVDLLFLCKKAKIPAWVEAVVESCLYMLWDLRLKVGHATRSMGDCLKMAKSDFTIRTALLETRYVIGNHDFAYQLHERLRSELFSRTGTEFVDAKLAERRERHKKQGGQRYVVEPNVKEGKGGLRDLQSLFWIAKYIHNVDDPADLVDLGVFSSEEYDRFERAEMFLMAVRNQLHLIAGRAMDQLTFDLQVEVADRLGYQDYGGRRAVEHFMQDYFRHATTVGDLSRIFLTAIEATTTTRTSLFNSLFQRMPKVAKGYIVQHSRLRHEDDDSFLSNRLNLLGVFEEALRTRLLIHPDTMRLVASNLSLIDAEMRNSAEANDAFLRILLDHGNPERGLRRMNELDVLGSFIPEFQPVVAMMQFNMYHQFTVDEHTIQVIATLARIERGDFSEELETATAIMQAGEIDRKTLYLALFFHDIGKGRNEDHSIVGSRIARRVCPRLGLSKEETATVEWLVRYHLLMSDMAQKRDPSDPRTVRDFAKAVKTKKRLELLYLLTICDIKGVGPGVWNNWKGTLFRRLYHRTEAALANGLEDLNRGYLETEAKTALAHALSGWPAEKIAAEEERHYGPYWQGLPTATQTNFARMLDGLGENKVGVSLAADPDRDATQVCFAMADHPGIFARLTGSLALVGANIVDARTFTTKDGFVTASFWVQDQDGAPYDSSRLPTVEKTIHKILSGEVLTRDAMKSRDKIKKRERKFQVPTSITFDNEGSDIYTIIEVDTRDRPGLLFDLTRTLAAANIYISSAHIATYGAQVVDVFYVKDMFGLKIVSAPKQVYLQRQLEEAIREGAVRAAE